MPKLDSLDRWIALPVGSRLTLPGDAPRRIRLNVNSPGLTPLYIVTPDGEVRFLASAYCRDTIEFAAGGNVVIMTETEHVSVYSAENEPTFTVIENAESYTQIANRAARNPDLEYIEFMQNQNMERRLAALAAEIEARVAKAYDTGKATITKSDAPGTVADEPREPVGEQPPSGGASGEADGDPEPA